MTSLNRSWKFLSSHTASLKIPQKSRRNNEIIHDDTTNESLQTSYEQLISPATREEKFLRLYYGISRHAYVDVCETFDRIGTEKEKDV